MTERSVIDGGMGFTAYVEDTSSGKVLVLEARGPDGCEYVWDTGDGRTRTTGSPKMAFRAP